MENKDLNGKTAEKEYEERNVMLDDDESVSEEDIQNTVLEDSDMNAFQKFIARIDDKKFLLYQRLFGILLGILTALSLLWGEITGNVEASGYSLVVSVSIALLVPSLLERKVQRRINAVRTAMAITLLILLAAYFLYYGIQNGFQFKA